MDNQLTAGEKIFLRMLPDERLVIAFVLDDGCNLCHIVSHTEKFVLLYCIYYITRF